MQVGGMLQTCAAPLPVRRGCCKLSANPSASGDRIEFCPSNLHSRQTARADGYVMPQILPDFDRCDQALRCPGSVEKLERRDDDTEEVIRER